MGMMQPVIEAHRGDSATAPENTMAAFRRAVELGVAWIELDVHPCRDGGLVVIHDDTLDRTTNGRGPVSAMTTHELRRLDAGAWFGPAFVGQRLPLLEDVLDMVASTGTRLNVEVKDSPTGLDAAGAVVRMLRRFGQERESVVSSFDIDALLAVRAVAPEVTLALIGSAPGILSAARQHRIPWVHAEHASITEAWVAEAHDSGIDVNAWTVDDPAALPKWRAMGLDKLCTNRPAAMLAASGTATA